MDGDGEERCLRAEILQCVSRLLAVALAFAVIFAVVSQMPSGASDGGGRTAPILAAAGVGRYVVQQSSSAEVRSRHLAGVKDSEHYYRGLLDADSQRAYDAIEEGVRSFSRNIHLERGFSAEELNKIIGYVVMDSPDILWFDGEAKMMGQGELYNSVVPEYLKDYSSSESELLGFLRWEDGLPRRGDDAEQMLAIMDYIADAVSHDRSGLNDQTISSSMDGGKAVCAGYAKLTVLLARDCGIPAVYIVGQGYDERHAWVAAKVGEEILFYDPYWYDGDGVSNPQWVGCELNAFSQSHCPDDACPLPEA